MQSLLEYRAQMNNNDIWLFAIFAVAIIGAMVITRLRIRPLWMIMGLAYLIRVSQFGQAVWYDESFTGAVARLPFERIHHILLSDVHAPLMYLPSWLSVRLFGYGDWQLRLPSLIFGMVGLWLIIQLASRWHLPIYWVGILVAFDASHVMYSVEARGYALLAMLVLIGVWALATGKRGYFLLMGLAPLVTAVGYVYLAILSIFAINRRWFGVLIASWVIAGIWLPIMLMQSNDVADGFWLGLNGVLLYLVTWVGKMPAVPTVISLLIGFGIVAWAWARWIKSAPALYHALWMGVPMVMLVASIVWQPIFLMRALLPSTQLTMMMIAPYPRLRAVALLIMAVALGLSFDEDYQRVDLRPAIARCNQADWIYTTSVATTIWVSHYSTKHVITYPYPDDLNQTLSDVAKNELGFIYATLDDLVGTVCIIHQDNPMITDTQRQFMAGVMSMSPAVIPVKNDRFFDISIYEVVNG